MTEEMIVSWLGVVLLACASAVVLVGMVCVATVMIVSLVRWLR